MQKPTFVKFDIHEDSKEYTFGKPVELYVKRGTRNDSESSKSRTINEDMSDIPRAIQDELIGSL